MIEKTLIKAASALNARKHKEALILINQVLSIDSENILALHWRAICCRHCEKPLEALQAMIMVISRHPEIPGAIQNLGNILSDVMRIWESPKDAALSNALAKEVCRLVGVCRNAGQLYFPEQLLPILCLTLIRHGALVEAVDVALASLDLCPPASAVPFDCQIGLIERYIIDDALTRRAAAAAVRHLRIAPHATRAIACLLFYAYRQRQRIPERLVESMFRRLTQEQILADRALHDWYKARTSRTFFSQMALNPLPDAVPEGRFPDTTLGDRPYPGCILLSCDEVYWHDFAWHLVDDLLASLGPYALHINLVDASPATRQSLIDRFTGNPAVGLTFMTSPPVAPGWSSDGGAKTFYACSRFLVVPALMAHVQAPVLTLDTDQALSRPITQFMADIERRVIGDAAVNDGGLTGPAKETVCDICLFRPTFLGQRFADLLCHHVSYFLAQGTDIWCIDQGSFLATAQFLSDSDPAFTLARFGPSGINPNDYLLHASARSTAERIALLCPSPDSPPPS